MTIDRDSRQFGRVVRRLRLRRGWSQAFLADRVGKHRVSVVRLEGGEVVARLQDLRVFALAFGMEKCDLLKML